MRRTGRSVASASAAVTAATAAAITAASATAAAAGPGRALASFVDRQVTALEVIAIQGLHGLLGGLLAVHLDEAETSRTARLAVHDHFHRSHGAISGEQRFE